MTISKHVFFFVVHVLFSMYVFVLPVFETVRCHINLRGECGKSSFANANANIFI